MEANNFCRHKCPCNEHRKCRLSGDGTCMTVERNIFPMKIFALFVALPCDFGFWGAFFSALGSSQQGHPFWNESLFALWGSMSHILDNKRIGHKNPSAQGA